MGLSLNMGLSLLVCVNVCTRTLMVWSGKKSGMQHLILTTVIFIFIYIYIYIYIYSTNIKTFTIIYNNTKNYSFYVLC
jgi:hypothetical protein